ncbi:MAG TPA: hypothetical protein VJ792_08715 [Candidatus Nitrosotalea sp.]|nr:hypothetical protein [Candidatus Nitrosotalea sp.]
MALISNILVASIVMTVMPFYGDIFSAIAQVSAKSLLPVLLSTLGFAI